MCIEIAALQELAGKAFQNILQVLPTVSGAQREALLEAMNALDDIEAMVDAADDEVPDDADGLRSLTAFAADRARTQDALGENVEHLALWRSRPVADMPAAAAIAEGQRGLRLPTAVAARGRYDGAESRKSAIRLGA